MAGLADQEYYQEQLMERGIRIGAFEMSRVSVGTMEECKLYIDALKKDSRSGGVNQTVSQ